jgi:hypothetical protein
MNTGVELAASDMRNITNPISNQADAFQKVKAAGANYVRLILNWRSSAMSQTTPPADLASPSSYKWNTIDSWVQRALANGLKPMITVYDAPTWAEHRFSTDPSQWRAGTVRPDADMYAAFATAAVNHFKALVGADKHFAWEVWNEPNLTYFLQPQRNLSTGKWLSPPMYRNLLNKFYNAVHAADPSAVVVGGSTAPFGKRKKPGPLLFFRKVACLTNKNRKAANCTVKADAWSTHPYTEGGPTHHAVLAADVSLGDLPELHAAMRAGVRVGNVKSGIQFWVGEFGWDSKGPDSLGVPLTRHARWISEALYRSWRAGVSIFIFHQLRDRPFPEAAYQSGLYFCGAPGLADDGFSSNECEGSSFSFANDVKKAKTWRSAYFPFVAYAGGGRMTIWGRTPNSTPGVTILIQRKTSSGFKTIKTITANSVGIFSKRFISSMTRGYLRARYASDVNTFSLPFSVVRQRDRPAKPWGCGGPLPCP